MASDEFRGRSMELHELHDRCNVIQDEVRGAMEDSRKAMLFCQQVRKEVQVLITTDMDDRETYGGIASLLASTNNLVEKFAAFEVYLRDKLKLEEDARESRIVETVSKLVARATQQLQDDVRQTLVTFKEEIISLKAKTTANESTQRRLSEEVREEQARQCRQLSERLESTIEQKIGDFHHQVKEENRAESARQSREEVSRMELAFERKLAEATQVHEDHMIAIRRDAERTKQRLSEIAAWQEACERDWTARANASRAVCEDLDRHIGAVRGDLLTAVDVERKRTEQSFSDQAKTLAQVRHDVNVEHAAHREAVAALRLHLTEQVGLLEKGRDNAVKTLRSEVHETLESKCKSLQQQAQELRDVLAVTRQSSSAQFEELRCSHRTALAEVRTELESIVEANVSAARANVATYQQEAFSGLSQVTEAQRLTSIRLAEMEESVATKLDQINLSVRRSISKEIGRITSNLNEIKQESVVALRVTTKSAVESLMERMENAEHTTQRRLCEQRLSHQKQVASIFSRQTQFARRRFSFHQWLRYCLTKKQDRRRRAALEWMVLQRAASLRAGYFFRWLRFGIQASRQHKLRVLRHSVATLTERELQRVYFTKLRKFIVARRAQKRKRRHAEVMLRLTSRGLSRLYFIKWTSFARLRGRQRLSENIRLMTQRGTLQNVFQRWQRYSRRASFRHNRRSMVCGLLALASGTGAVGTRSRYFASWRNWVIRKRFDALQRSVDRLNRHTGEDSAKNGQVMEQLSSSVALVTAQMRQLTHLSRRHIDTSRQSAAVAHETLLQALAAAVGGSGSFPDVLVNLSDWVHAVDSSQRSCSKSIRDLWEWAKSVDEEIHRVQRFVRPTFKS